MIPRNALAMTLAVACGWTMLGAAPTRPFAEVKPCANKNLFKLPVVQVVTEAEVLYLAVASTEKDRELGLQCVTSLLPNTGMLFVFDTDEHRDFWMKNTLIPLDIIWVHANGKADAVARNVPPSYLGAPEEDVPRRFGVGKYVIEIQAGEARLDNIHPFGLIKIPKGLKAH
jgi:uncharacterized membrane protein (UPF0127 family)